MPPELTEFQQIVDGEWEGGSPSGRRPTADELKRTLQVLLTRQCIYPSTPGAGRTYDIVRAYAPFFERWLSAMNYKLVVSPRDQMVAVSVPRESRYDTMFERLGKQETLVLLCLRLMWEEALSSQDVADGGIAETTTGDLVDRIKSVTQAEPPEESALADILRYFQQIGAVRVGERDRIERVSPLSILPGVNVLVPDSFVDELRTWAAAPRLDEEEPESEPEDLERRRGK